jgi:hypothetical protein
VPDNSFSEEFYDRWQHLLEDIDMTDIPLNFVAEISVNLKSGEVVTFDIVTMRAKKMSAREIEETVESFLHDNDEDVNNIDFHINIKSVAETVTAQVSKILDK